MNIIINQTKSWSPVYGEVIWVDGWIEENNKPIEYTFISNPCYKSVPRDLSYAYRLVEKELKELLEALEEELKEVLEALEKDFAETINRQKIKIEG